jgi:hypothetical protein
LLNWLKNVRTSSNFLASIFYELKIVSRLTQIRIVERKFQVGEEVLLKLQPYAQTSVVNHPYAKLAFKYFGPFKILERVNMVEYKLPLLQDCAIHPVFYVSQLKPHRTTLRSMTSCWHRQISQLRRCNPPRSSSGVLSRREMLLFHKSGFNGLPCHRSTPRVRTIMSCAIDSRLPHFGEKVHLKEGSMSRLSQHLSRTWKQWRRKRPWARTICVMG